MCLGCGMGDISGLAVKVYSAYQDAPDDYRHIWDELKSFQLLINMATQHFEVLH